MVPDFVAQWGAWCAVFALEAGLAFLHRVRTLMLLLSVSLSPQITLLYSCVTAPLCSGRESLGIKSATSGFNVETQLCIPKPR